MIASPSLRAQNLIDLHSHLFMNEGLTYLFHGDFFDKELSANSWDDLFSLQTNPKTVNESGIRILVASLYAASPLLTPGGLRNAIREGLYNIAQSKELWQVMEMKKARIPQTDTAIQYFLNAWARVTTPTE